MTQLHLLTAPQLAERWNEDVRAVRKMIGLGQLPSVRVGARVKVPLAAVEQFERIALAANVGTQTALRIMALIAAERLEASHVTGEDR